MRKLLIGVGLLAMVPLLRADVQVIETVCPNGAKARYFEEMVSMPDGVKLYTYGAVPPDGMKCPIVIQRNPYVKDERVKPETFAGQKWTPDSYVWITQHCRGCGRSEGDWIPYVTERADGLAFLEWIRKLPFYNGEIFLNGGSYLSSVHFLYIDTNPPDIKGAVLAVQDCNRYNIVYRNGFFKIGLHGNWFIGGYKKKNTQLQRDRSVSFCDLPLCDFSKRYFGEAVPWLDSVFAHPREDDPFWKTVEGGYDSYEAVTKASFPILLTTGMYDIYTGGIFDMWARMPAAQRARCALVVGAYDHGGNNLVKYSKKDSMPVEFPEGSLAMVCPNSTIQWFDHIRKGTPLTFIQPGKTSYYALYENAWHHTDKLVNGPVPHTFYLNNRTLDAQPGTPAAISYVYDPKNPVPFKGGLCLNFGGMPVQDPPNFRPDVISFLSKPFTQELDVRGRMTARLVCTSDCEDTCFYVRLSLVKDGVAYPLRDDITSLCYATPDYTPGTEKAVDFCFSDHAFRISPGDVLRLDVSSSCSYFVPHTNNKGLQSIQKTSRVANNAIICGKSSVTLFCEAQADFWVAPNGKDSDPGTKERPFATLARARDAVRALRQAEPDRDILVLLRNGVYSIVEPVEFSPEDSGRVGGRITYAAAPGATPVISGGRRITGFEPCGDGVWKTTVPDVRDGKWRIEQLYVNGCLAVPARTPNGHYAYIESTVKTGIDPRTGESGPIGDRAFLAHSKDIAPLLKLPPERLRDVVVSAYHSWDVSRHRVVSIDPEHCLVLLTGSYKSGFGRYTHRERYYLSNFREALDAPGEWFLDRDGTLFYMPRPGEDMAKAEVVAPVPETLLRLAGKAGGARIENILFQGLTFEYAAYLMPQEGMWPGQAAARVDAVVMADYARNIVFADCSIRRTGTYGIWFRDGCRDCAVERCLLEDLGAGGVRLGPTAHRPSDAGQLTSHCRIDNNIIRYAGRVWPDAVGILVGHSGDNQITHNDIAGMPYSGISVGWHWGYGDVPSKRNTISYNRIHHLGWDVLADMGGVYALGEAPGTVVCGNVFHDFAGDGNAGMHGVFTDNSVSYMRIESNLVYNVRDGGYKIGSGKDNIVRNNIFVSRPRDKGTPSGPVTFCMHFKGETHHSVTIEKNIICGCDGRVLHSPEFGDRLKLQNNLYWEPSGEPIRFIGHSFEEWQKMGRDAGSVIADPKFVDFDNNDFCLQADSPALALGFVPFDTSRAGVYGDLVWIAKARAFAAPPPWQGLPPPPPVTFYDGFEHTDVGSRPSRAYSRVEGKGDNIEVTEETAATGKRSLKITDAPGLEHGFNPHFSYAPNHREGITTFSFDVRMEQGAELSLEWRQQPGKPHYYIGPKLLFRNGQLTFADQPPLPLPLGVWTHIEISAGFGSKTDGTWQLTVTTPGAEPKHFSGLKFVNPETRSVTWLGFISVANCKGVYYIDNVKLETDFVEEARALGAGVK